MLLKFVLCARDILKQFFYIFYFLFLSNLYNLLHIFTCRNCWYILWNLWKIFESLEWIFFSFCCSTFDGNRLTLIISSWFCGNVSCNWGQFFNLVFSWGKFCFEHFYVRYLENKEKPGECDCHHSAQTEKYADVEMDSIIRIYIKKAWWWCHGNHKNKFFSVIVDFPISSWVSTWNRREGGSRVLLERAVDPLKDVSSRCHTENGKWLPGNCGW